ncbi:MAG: hypothetical protein ACRD1Y_11895 [Terriglobales bacterium]
MSSIIGLFRHNCRKFILAAEEFLDGHSGPAPLPIPASMNSHLASCTACRERWATVLRSRSLTLSLQTGEEPALDPYFYDRLRARIAAARHGRARFEIRWRHVVLACALFLACLSSFAYDMHRTETPNADEAIALDVPHINPQHPSDSHLHPRLADAMLNLMNP